MYKITYTFPSLSIIFLVITLCAPIASANPLPFSPSPPNPSIAGFVGTALLSYPLNLLFLAVFSSLLVKFSKDDKFSTISHKIFGMKLLIISVLVTITGALVDQLLVIKPLYDFGYIKFYPSYSFNFIFDYLLLTVALVIIFLSVFLSFILIRKAKIRHSFIIGLGMIGINMLFWSFAIYILPGM
jgi:hypothetical protein